jgi:integrase
MTEMNSTAPALSDKSTVPLARPADACPDTRSDTRHRPQKPYPDFPLFPHATGRWAKKIRGKLYYFGPWENPDAALEKYLAQRDALHAGQKPQASTGELTIKELCNRFLRAKRAFVDSGELTMRSWKDYEAAARIVVAQFGKGRLVANLDPDDFAALRRKLAKKWGPVTLGNVIQRIRVIFKYAWDSVLIDRPVRYGQSFKRPSRKTIRLDRARKGPKLFTAKEIHQLLKAAPVHLRAMVLLGINCGFGNADCGQLPLSALNLQAGWVDFPRPKTGIPRRCPLWRETVKTIRQALAKRPKPKSDEHAGLVFITKYGLPWAKDTTDQTIAKEFGKLLRALHINGRTGLGFYTLRHVFRTVADESRDQPAVDYVMGHESPSMATHYRESISDTRLKAVAAQVHGWLFGRS